MEKAMRLLFLYLLLAGLAVLLTGCGLQAAASTASPTTTLTVFAAASLTESFTETAVEFEASHPNVDVVLNFAGSQALRLQIEQGARFDVFASANENHMQALVEANFLRDPALFTQNQLVVIMPASNPASIETLSDLARPDLKLILAGPNVPVGRYARETLEKLNHDPTLGADYAARVLDNLVSEEDNVKNVVAKIRLGEADAGIVYVSDVTPTVAAELATLPIPPEFNVVATYPLAVAVDSASSELAQQFVEFVLSPRGQTILAYHGFQPTQVQAIGQKE
jgi:molybdate transport system substrate-binding protein